MVVPWGVIVWRPQFFPVNNGKVTSEVDGGGGFGFSADCHAGEAKAGTRASDTDGISDQRAKDGIAIYGTVAGSLAQTMAEVKTK